MAQTERPFLTVDIERRGYGRRYTSLPVDELSRDGFAISFDGSYIRPAHIDIRPGDIARWRDGGRLVQAEVAEVGVDGSVMRVRVEGARPLPPEAFHP